MIDALFINGGGTKILLDYLAEELEKTGEPILYLLDSRIRDHAPTSATHHEIVFIDSSLWKRRKFYTENRNKFNTVFCFANLPPPVRLSAKTYTYFHQKLFIAVPPNTRFISRIKYWAKTKVLSHIRKNTNRWMVQTELMKELLASKYGIPQDKILVRPFFRSRSATLEPQKVKNTFLYVSNATPHKNHRFLIEEFCSFFDQQGIGELILTVSDRYEDIYQLINGKIERGYPIRNLGFIDRDSLQRIYELAEFVIYPSLSESFGLGLVEGIEAGCKIIGADLEYLHEVCKPSLTFDPYKEHAISISLAKAVWSDLPISTLKVDNSIGEIIEALI